MSLNAVTALILLYFTEFNSFAGLLLHSGWRYTYIVCRISQHGLCTIAELLVEFNVQQEIIQYILLLLCDILYAECGCCCCCWLWPLL